MLNKIFVMLWVLTLRVLCLNGPNIRQLTEPLDHGEEPFWDPRTGMLYYVDIFEGNVLSYNPTTGEENSIHFDGNVTPVIPSLHNPHIFLVGVDRTLMAVKWYGRGRILARRNLTVVSQQFPDSKFNDGKPDKKGRLWFGTQDPQTPNGIIRNQGVLYFITRENLKNPYPALQPIDIGNGLAWNRQNNKFYYIDTATACVQEFDYDNELGEISNPQIVFNLTLHSNLIGIIDGMTIDKDDNLWIGLCNGGLILKVNPRTGCILQEIALPAICVSSCIWGGPNLDILYVTTSRRELSDYERKELPAAGSLFAVTNLGTNGLPPFYANIVDRIY